MNAPRDRQCEVGVAAYRILTGCHPADAVIDDDFSFDRHVLASILAVAAMENGAIAERTGLTAADLASLMAHWFPAACGLGLAGRDAHGAEDDETAMVRDLLLAHRSTESETSRWLAGMIARRAMEPNHLWEDLGLRERPELTRLLFRHFAPIATKNTQNMKWKRFFYRALCESDGFVMCTTPVCTECKDFDLCFGDESGESRMAGRRREVMLASSFEAAPPAWPAEQHAWI
ncbi:nitrogen fixation protein NifQ [Bradyrhizobium roseum]|uniref:nitrogen fixation protein NifQ n=1 Tax=Bradyrhizobium roseum TaxID=3056648 RepID=UPI0026146322|nr:nitrogen fixation protein NifQ [Bradyrhizobium roseus]WKA32204.1 nitrogen fixation protein NifQ [Bradyrhizobium roseus]